MGMCHSSVGSLGTAREQFVPQRHRTRPHRQRHEVGEQVTDGVRDDGGVKTLCSVQGWLAGIQVQDKGSTETMMPRFPIN